MSSESSKKIFKFSKNFNTENVIEKSLKFTDSSYYIVNLSDVIRKYNDWMKYLPRIKPFYAIKCNNDVNVIRTLASLGCSFDCATLWEIEQALSVNVSPERIIFASTTKLLSHIAYAKKHNVRLMTFDNEDELEKISKIYPEADLIMRIRYNSENAIYKLGRKFGCDPITEAPLLLKHAKSLNLNVVGISFHIGSSCEDYEAYVGAIEASRTLFDFAKEIGYNFKILDIGGGFFGDSFDRIKNFSCIINNALDKEFPNEKFPNVEIFSEPGRYFVESAFTLISHIHSRKITRDTNGCIQDVMYYQDEGVFSSFISVPIGPETITPKVLPHNRFNEKFVTTVWGPTLDSTDKVCANVKLELMEIGDVLYYENMGAYTFSLRTPFHGFKKGKMYYFINIDDCNKIDNSYEIEFADFHDF